MQEELYGETVLQILFLGIAVVGAALLFCDALKTAHETGAPSRLSHDLNEASMFYNSLPGKTNPCMCLLFCLQQKQGNSWEPLRLSHTHTHATTRAATNHPQPLGETTFIAIHQVSTNLLIVRPGARLHSIIHVALIFEVMPIDQITQFRHANWNGTIFTTMLVQQQTHCVAQ